MSQLSLFENNPRAEFIQQKYKLHLGFCYGNKERLISEMEDGIKIYSSSDSPKAKDRAEIYKEIIKLAKQ